MHNLKFFIVFLLILVLVGSVSSDPFNIPIRDGPIIISFDNTSEDGFAFKSVSKNEKVITMIGEPEENKDYFVIKHFNNESEIIINIPPAKKQNMSVDDGVVTIKQKEYDMIFYMFENNNGLEWLFNFSKKPKDMNLTFPINFTNIRFSYQSPLNERYNNYTHCNETECWDENNVTTYIMDDNMVGGYTIYHSSKKGGIYKNGKIAQIRKLILEDDDGLTSVANISINNTHMGITLPETWMKNIAKYPVILDPTFGYTTCGSTGMPAGDEVHYYRIKAEQTGTLVAITSCMASYESPTVYHAIYEDNASNDPHDLIEQETTGYVAGNWANGDWETTPMAGTTTIVNGTYYWIAEVGDSTTNGGLRIRGDYNSYLYENATWETGTTFPDPATAQAIGASSGDGDYDHSIYLAYTTEIWDNDTTIVNGLPDIGGSSSPEVFYMDSEWHLIAGEYSGVFNGYTWNGSGWDSNTTLEEGLPDVGDHSTPSVFNISDNYHLIAGEWTGVFNGYTWNGSGWDSNSSVVSGLPDVGTASTPNIFYMDGTWNMIAGEGGNVFNGYTWNGSGWDSNSSLVTGLTTDGSSNPNPNVYERDGTFYNLNGVTDGNLYGYALDGIWSRDYVITHGFFDVGSSSDAKTFELDGDWYTIIGEGAGIFNGFKLTSLGSVDNSPVVSLISPSNGTSSTNTSFNFTCQVSDDIQGDNVTLNVWYDNNTVFNTSTNSSTFSTDVNVTWNVSSFVVDTYYWNCQAFDNASQSSWANNNYTLTVNNGTSCTCPVDGSNWEINLADNCETNTDCNNVGNITLTGTGNWYINSTINCSKIDPPPSGGAIWIRDNARIKIRG